MALTAHNDHVGVQPSVFDHDSLRAYNFALQRKYAFPSAVQVVEDVTKLLPDDTSQKNTCKSVIKAFYSATDAVNAGTDSTAMFAAPKCALSYNRTDPQTFVLVNGVPAAKGGNAPLKDGDEVSLLSAVAGG